MIDSQTVKAPAAGAERGYDGAKKTIGGKPHVAVDSDFRLLMVNLTTAVVERRGVDADDGPTLTALRRLRDGYMTRTPASRVLVAEYCEIAPAIVAAIPEDHPDWGWIAERIDAGVAAIEVEDDLGAFGAYVEMVRRLSESWSALNAQ